MGQKVLVKSGFRFLQPIFFNLSSATRLPMDELASAWVSTPIAFSNEAASIFCMSLSSATASAISLSFSKLRARMMTTNGISVGAPAW